VTAQPPRSVPVIPGPTTYLPAIPGPRIPLLDSLSARPRSIYTEFYDPEGARYGTPTYPFKWAPKGWLTRRQLRGKGQLPAGQMLWKHRGRRRVACLYLESLALPVRPIDVGDVAGSLPGDVRADDLRRVRDRALLLHAEVHRHLQRLRREHVMSGGWGVRVNEVGIFATGQGADWWTLQLARWETSGPGRALCLGLCPQGGVWFLPVGDKDDAAWARDHIIGHGVPRKFVTVTTAARAEAERARNAGSRP
jgi:hypothetical protein